MIRHSPLAALLCQMVLFDLAKEEELGFQPTVSFGDSSDERHEPDNYWIELAAKITKGTLSGGTSPAWKADAGDKLVKKLSINVGGSITPISASVENLKRLALLEHGEEVEADGFFHIPFGGPFPGFLFKNGLRFKHEFDSLANLTTGSPTGQSGTKITYYAQKYPRQGAVRRAVGYPVIKTIEKDIQSISGRREIVNLNSGNLLRHMLIIPSSGTLLNEVEVSIADGEDVLRKLPWDVLREWNKRRYFMDTAQAASGFGALTFPGIKTDRGEVGKLALYADVNSEASGKVTVVTYEYMNPAEEAALLKRLQQ